MHEPILIVGMPRSGTSMTAGVFARHGVWVGTHQPGDHLNERGHFENLPIKRAKKAASVPAAHVCVNQGIPAEPVPGWRRTVLEARDGDGYTGGPWLFKMSAMFWRMFDAAFDPTWVCVVRNPAEIRRSAKATGLFSATDEAIQAHLAVMVHLADHKGGIIVRSSDVARGDLSTMVAALEHAGLEPDRGLIEGFVEPALWRHG